MKLGRLERRASQERRQADRDVGDRRLERPAPHELSRCQAGFVRVGHGDIYRVKWLGDRWTPWEPTLEVSSFKCDCSTVFAVMVERTGRRAG